MAKKPVKDQDLKRVYADLMAERAAAADRSDCPAPEELLATAESKIEEGRGLGLLDHAASCPACLDELKLLLSLAEGRRALE